MYAPRSVCVSAVAFAPAFRVSSRADGAAEDAAPLKLDTGAIP